MMTSGATTRLDPDWVRMVELRAGVGMTSLDTKSSSRLHYAILTILDTIFSALVAAPAVVGYWRGTWGLSDFYVYPGEPMYSSFTSIIIGYIGLFAFNVFQHGLDDILHPDKHRLFYYLGSRLYTSVFGLCCVNAWRGAWQALDVYTELTSGTVFAITAISLLTLGIMRAIRNLSAPPFSLVLDSCPGYFEVQTMFRVNVSTRIDDCVALKLCLVLLQSSFQILQALPANFPCGKFILLCRAFDRREKKAYVIYSM